ncbi:MAG: hypothetical protein HYV29_13590 [Ignavibacteriales bacterium]|nr:hypothetical protein [Ignavibacteriales bacterium]
MLKCPLPITIIGWLFIAAGAVGFVYHTTELHLNDPFANDAAWVLLVRLLAIVGGIALVRGAEWGRWLAVAWLAYHVVLSYSHTLSELIMHAALLAVVAYFLFRPKTNEYFKTDRNIERRG